MFMVSLSLKIYKKSGNKNIDVRDTFKSGWRNSRKEFTWPVIYLSKLNSFTLAIK